MKKLSILALSLVWITAILSTSTVWAQEDSSLTLNLSRDFGYSGAGDIQGTFTLRASGPQDLNQVVFMIDNKVIGEVNQAPFRLQFNTGNFDLGLHTLSAIGYTNGGRELHSNEIRAKFVTAGEGWQAALRIIIPVLAVTVLAILGSALVPWITGRNKKSNPPLGAPRSYGLSGGAVCPKCSRPFSRHWWGINLMVGKLDRCPYCGKWSIVSRAMPSELAAAEAAELQAAKDSAPKTEISAEERLRQDLESSRYQDL